MKRGEAVIRPSLIGLCKTDLELSKGYMGFTGVLGHEFVGFVEECDSPEWIGKRVVGEINCLVGTQDPRHHPERSVLGILGRDGVMAERFCLPTENLLEVPSSVPDEVAVFVEPLAAAFQIYEQVPQLPERILVLGDGKLGSLCALSLAQTGSKVTLVGKHLKKLKAVESLVETRLLDQLGEESYSLVVEATGSATGLTFALNHVQPRGTVILKTTVATPHQLDLSTVVINEIRILGSRCGRFQPALQALIDEKIDPRFLIEARYTMDDAMAAFDHAAQPGAAKILLTP